MAFKSSQASVGVAAAAVVTPPAGQVSPLNVLKVTLCNRHATQNVFVGGSDVTTANGYQIKAGESLSLEIDLEQDVLFAVADGAATPLHILKARS